MIREINEEISNSLETISSPREKSKATTLEHQNKY